MKYRKADEVLPDALLREIQKYVSGETLYIPKAQERRRWGAASGARDYYSRRNAGIRARHAAGESAETLAAEYGLTVESIRKIIYERAKE